MYLYKQHIVSNCVQPLKNHELSCSSKTDDCETNKQTNKRQSNKADKITTAMFKRKAIKSASACRAVRARRTDVLKPPAMREAVTAVLNNIVQQIETRKAKYGGKLPYGTISSIVESHKVNFPWLDVNKVNYHM